MPLSLVIEKSSLSFLNNSSPSNPLSQNQLDTAITWMSSNFILALSRTYLIVFLLTPRSFLKRVRRSVAIAAINLPSFTTQAPPSWPKLRPKTFIAIVPPIKLSYLC